MLKTEEISNFEQNYFLTYTHSNGFTKDNSLVLHKIVSPGCYAIVKFNIDTSMEEVLVGSNDSPMDFDLAYETQKLVYSKDKALYLRDINSSDQARKVWQADAMADIHMQPSIMEDGSAVVVYRKQDDKFYMDRINLNDFTAEVLIETDSYLTHVQFCPYDPSWIGFCHEGDTKVIYDRVWVWNKEYAPKGICIYDQLSDEPGKLLCVGHERWSFHDISAYVVAYGVSPAGPRGLWEVFPDGRKPRYVSKSDNDWHCDISRDGKWAVVDTTGKCEQSGEFDMGESGISDIVLVNTTNGQRYHVARSRIHHAGEYQLHPHPRFSPDGKWIYFNYAGGIEPNSANSVRRVDISSYTG